MPTNRQLLIMMALACFALLGGAAEGADRREAESGGEEEDASVHGAPLHSLTVSL